MDILSFILSMLARFAINSASEYKEGAWEFLEYLLFIFKSFSVSAGRLFCFVLNKS